MMKTPTTQEITRILRTLDKDPLHFLDVTLVHAFWLSALCQRLGKGLEVQWTLAEAGNKKGMDPVFADLDI